MIPSTLDIAVPTKFDLDIGMFNEMYKMPTIDRGTTLQGHIERVKNFRDILAEEMKELDEIIDRMEVGSMNSGYDDRVDFLTDFADFCGDVQVYCASELKRFGVRNSPILDIIMKSNFSKLGADGLPIYDDRGKVMKGPDYWKPEPLIQQHLIATGA